MKFNLIIGNPPYSKVTGGGTVTESATPLYNEFIVTALNNITSLNLKYLSMIIPSRWMSGGRQSLDDMRRIIIEQRHLKKVFNYSTSTDIFEGVDIAGGVQYFLIDLNNTFNKVEFHNIKMESNSLTDNTLTRSLGDYKYIDSNGNEQYMIIVDNQSVKIVDKVMKNCEEQSLNTLNSFVLPHNPFGITSDFQDSDKATNEKQIKVACSYNRVTFTDKNKIESNIDKIEKYKVCTGRINPDRGGLNGGEKSNVLNFPFILNPNEVCSRTYLVLSTHNTKEEANNALEYIKTKFVRFLILATISGISINSKNFQFIPYEDFSRRWTDKDLYKKYSLTQEEIEYIESKIKVMK